MWAEYNKECLGFDSYINEHGFVLYRIENDQCFIQDLYIKKDSRGKELFRTLVDVVVEAAKKHKCNRLVSQINVANATSSASISMHTKYGMKLVSAHNNVLLFLKEI